MQAVTSGSNNVGIGGNAGGFLAGVNCITTGNYNTFIGTNTIPSSTTQVDYMTLIGAGTTGSRSNAIFLGRANGADTTVAQGPLEAGGAITLKSYTVAGLPMAGLGKTAFASNGRRAGEAAGAGTGIPVWSDAGNWRTYYDNSVVSA